MRPSAMWCGNAPPPSSSSAPWATLSRPISKSPSSPLPVLYGERAPGRGRSPLPLLGCLDQRATSLVQRTEGLVARHGLDDLGVIPLPLRFRWSLDLHQVHVAQHAAVD